MTAHATSNGVDPNQEFIGSIDCGTTSCRFFIFSDLGEIVARHQIEFEQIYPEPGWHEHDPMAYITAIDECMRKAILNFESLGYLKSSIKTVGITNQRETTICWDRTTGLPLYNAVAWPDSRNRAVVEELRIKAENFAFKTGDGLVRGEAGVQSLTGLPFSTYFSATKFTWMVQNVDAIAKAKNDGTLMIGTVDSWVMYNLTDEKLHITDYTNASRTLLLSLSSLQWDDQLLEFFDIPHSALPKLVSNAEVYGVFKKGNILEGVTISSLVGDQQAALLGNKCLSPGDKKNTYGTGLFMLYNCGTSIVKSSHGLLSTVAYKAGPNSPAIYALEGSISVGGSSLTWLRDNMGLIKTPAEAGELASTVSDTGGVYFVTGFSGLFAPYWDSSATGMLIGLSGFTTKNHIARATLEAVCFQTRAILEAMAKDSGLRLNHSTTNTSSPVHTPIPLPHFYGEHLDAKAATKMLVAEASAALEMEKNPSFSKFVQIGDEEVLKVDGGMTASDVTMQIQADILGISVARPKMGESTALGAALLAGSAIKLFDWDIDNPASLVRVNTAGVRIFYPSLKEEERAWKYAGWNRAVLRASAWKTESGNG